MRRSARIISWSLGGLCIALVVAALLLRPWAEDRLRRTLEQRLGASDRPSNDSLRIALDLLHGKAVVYDLHVEGDTAGADTGSVRFGFDVPYFEVDVGLWALLGGELHVDGLVLRKPRIRIHAPEHATRTDGGLATMVTAVDQVRRALSGYLHRIKARDLVIEEASVTYTKPHRGVPWHVVLGPVSVELRGLEVGRDDLDDPARIPLEELRIRIGAEHFTTPDGRVRYAIDSCRTSLRERYLAVSGLTMEAVALPGTVPATERLHLAALRIHGLRLEGEDADRRLVAGRIELLRPDIRIERNIEDDHQGSAHRPQGFRWAALLAQVLPGARLDTLEVVDGRVSIIIPAKDTVGIDALQLRLENTALAFDSAGIHVGHPTAGELELAGLHLHNASVLVKADRVSMHIGQRALQVDGLSVVPEDGAGPLPHVEAERVRLAGLDVPAWSDGRALRMDSASISEADVRMHVRKPRIRATTERKAPPEQVRVPLLALLEKAGISALYVGDLRVTGSAEVPPAAHAPLNGKVDHFDLHSTGLRCPEAPDEPHRDLYADRTDVVLSGVAVNDVPAYMGLRVARLEASTDQRRMDLVDVGLKRGGARPFAISAQQLSISGFDLPALLEQRGLFLRKLAVRRTKLVLDLPAAPDRTAGPAASPFTLARHLHVDTLDVNTEQLVVRRVGVELATVDSFYIHLRGVRPDPVRSTAERVVFIRTGTHYGGRRVHAAFDGDRFDLATFDVDLDAGRGSAQGLSAFVTVGHRRFDIEVPRISGGSYDPRYVDNTDVLDLGLVTAHDARIHVQDIGPGPAAALPSGSIPYTGAMPLYSSVHAKGLSVQRCMVALDKGADSTALHAELAAVNVEVGECMHHFDHTDVRTRIGPVRMVIEHGTATRAHEEQPAFQVQRAALTAEGITLDRGGKPDVQGLAFEGTGISLPMAHGEQQVSVGKVDYAQDERRLIAEHVHLAPVMPQDDYAASRTYRTDALVVDIGRLRADGFDAQAALRDGRLEIARAEVDGLVLNDLRDHRLPFAPFRYKPLPSAALRKAGRAFRVDTVLVRDGTVHYAERSATGTGTVALEHIEACLTGLVAGGKAGASPLRLEASGLMQGQGRFRTEVAFLPGDTAEGFTFRFGLGRMELSAFNSILGPSAHVDLERGRLDTLFVLAEANDRVALGTMGMYYEGLHMGLLPNGPEHASGLLQTMGGWAANAVVRTNNRLKRRREPGAVYFERMQDRSVFQYLIKQTLSGIPGNVRLPDKKRKVRRSEDQELKDRLKQHVQP